MLKRAKELVDNLWADKDMGPRVRTKAKELFPDINIPEDAVTPVVQPASVWAALDALCAPPVPR